MQGANGENSPEGESEDAARPDPFAVAPEDDVGSTGQELPEIPEIDLGPDSIDLRSDRGGRDLAVAWESYWRTQSHEARTMVAQHYAHLPLEVGRQFAVRLPSHITADDLVSPAAHGLFRAIELFDPSMQVPFEAFARMSIKRAVQDELRASDWLPRGRRRLATEVRTITDRLEMALGRTPTPDEITARLDITHDTLAQALLDLRNSTPRSLDGGRTPDEDPPAELASSEPGPAEVTSLHARNEIIRREIERLEPRLCQAIKLYHFDSLNQREIGTLFGVSEARVSQLLGEAHRSLRARLNWEMRE